MALKNTYSRSTQTFDKIQKILAKHKVRQMFYEYDNEGNVTTLAFSIEVNGKMLGFKLPARVEQVQRLVPNKEQAYRTAWANIRDWLDAQMALIETQQVKIEEVFLPFMVDNTGKTLYESMKGREFQLPSGE